VHVYFFFFNSYIFFTNHLTFSSRKIGVTGVVVGKTHKYKQVILFCLVLSGGILIG